MARSAQTLAYFSELSEAQQAGYIDQFFEQADKTIKGYLRNKGLEMKVAKTAFGEWLADTIWGELRKKISLLFMIRAGCTDRFMLVYTDSLESIDAPLLPVAQ